MDRNNTARKKRNMFISNPRQRSISQYFTPRSGISKEEVNFLVKPTANPSSRGTATPGSVLDGQRRYSDQIILPPSLGFTSAADIYLQAGKWCSGTQKQSNLFVERHLASVLSNPEDFQVPCPTNSKNSSSEGKQTLIDGYTRVPEDSSSSSLSSSSCSSTQLASSLSSLSPSTQNMKRARRSTRTPKNLKGKSVKNQRSALNTIVIKSDDENSSNDSDCRFTNVVPGRKTKYDPEVEGNSIRSSSQAHWNDSCIPSGQVSLESTVSQTGCDKNNSESFQSTKQVKTKSSSRSTFGLVGGDINDFDEEDDSQDFNHCSTHFTQLPVEIMENIFCQLPMVDLMLNCALVCRQWYDIISQDSFIPWKKKYFLLKNKDSSSEDVMIELLERKGLLEVDLFPLNLASFMKDFKRKGSSSLMEKLKTHPKFPLIGTFLGTLTGSSKEVLSPWSVVALLTLVCQTVYEVQEIVHCMTRSTSCLVQDILECLYCLASVFYYLESQNRIGSGLHYRVFYTLYLYENAFQATCASLGSVFGQNSTGQQSMMRYRSSFDKLQLTHEQVRIIKHDVKVGEIIKIVAFAGTGKTTTLVEYTKMRPMERFLNVAYNKSIQEHAAKLFPSNVENRTIHSLAYRKVGFRYRHKLAYRLRISTIMNVLPSDCGYLHARRVEETLNNFIASADITVSPKHVPAAKRTSVDISTSEGSEIVISIFGEHGSDTSYLNSDKHIQKVVSHAQALWERMKDQGDKDFPITHDGYLKIYQLDRPVLDGYDCLLVDEAQDCTPAASDILLRQSCAKILVGDPHQQIYAFRGARNALQEVKGTHTFYLTQSFRFGPEIAYVASCVLDVLKGVRNKTLVGGANKGSVLGVQSGQVCVITRCNYTLFNEAVTVCCANNDKKVGFVGGLKSLALDRVMDIYRLFTADTNTPYLGIKDALIKKFRSFSELKKYAKCAPDPELLGKIKIVETHHVLLPQRIEKITSKAIGNLRQADIVFSTAHKAKGLEFDTVRVTDDFLPGTDIGVPLHDHGEDERNLVYVAVTRAKKSLQLNTTILNILGCRKEHFVRVVSPKELSQPALCADCKKDVAFSPQPHVVIQKESVILGGNVEMAGGVLCPTCAADTVPHLGCLVSVNNES
ncbi:F-box DNA helicase 1-like [Stylophora pistillata]|uniref:F-box DNA helicase 1-like n=1 Tax=Stylophora pistillata TaxID=50429 RepID=UPI000C052C3D|nr:F-box DNA helicase 1-like [Stylophora pistillata]